MAYKISGINKQDNFTVSNSTALSDSLINIDKVNDALKKALKKKEECTELQYVVDGVIHSDQAKKINFADLEKYFQTVLSDKPDQIAKFFTSTNVEKVFKETLNSTKRREQALVAKLIEYLKKPEDKRQKYFDEKLAPEFSLGKNGGIDIQKSPIFQALKRESKLKPLMYAIERSGIFASLQDTTEAINETRQGTNIDKKAIDAEIDKQLEDLVGVRFGPDGSIIDDNGNHLWKALEISQKDIEDIFGEKYKNNPPIKPGKISWKDLSAKIWKLGYKTNDLGKLIEYTNAIKSMFNVKVREALKKAGNNEELKELILERGNTLIDMFTGERDGLPDGLNASFQKALQYSAFQSDAAVNALSTGVIKEKVEATIVNQFSEISETLVELPELGKDTAARGKDDQDLISDESKKELYVLDKAGILDKANKGNSTYVKVTIGDNTGEQSFSEVKRAYKASANSIIDDAQQDISQLLFSTASKDPAAIRAYKEAKYDSKGKLLSGNRAYDAEDVVSSKWELDTSNTSNLDSTLKPCAKKLADVIERIMGNNDISLVLDKEGKEKLKEQIQTVLKDFLPKSIVPNGKSGRQALQKDISRIAGVIVGGLDAAGATTTSLEDRIQSGLTELITKTRENNGTQINTSSDEQRDIAGYIKDYFINQNKVEDFLSYFIAPETSQNTLSQLNFDAMIDIIKDQPELEGALMRTIVKSTDISEIADLERDNIHRESGAIANLLFAQAADTGSKRHAKNANLIGFIALLKEANIAGNETLLKNIASTLFSPMITSDKDREVQVKHYADKLKELIQGKFTTGAKTGQIFNVAEVSEQISSCITRAHVLAQAAREVELKKSSGVTNRLASMINSYVLPENRDGVIKAIEKVAGALSTVSNSDEEFDLLRAGVETKIFSELQGDDFALNLARSVFNANYTDAFRDSESTLESNKALQIAQEALTRLSMLLPKISTTHQPSAYSAKKDQEATPV